MKKIVAILIVTAFALSVVAMGAPVDRLPTIVTPSGTEIEVPPQAIASSPDIDEERLIVPTTSASDKLVFRLKGCTILHELNDATAIKCPKGVAIAGARPDRIFHVHDLKADRQINANAVWDLGCDGSGVLVAILDTGVDDTHIELNDSIKATENFVVGSVDSDTDGHGTHVSGIVTADGVYRIRGNYATGVAPGAEIIVGKVCGNNGCYESEIVAGIEWAVAEGADVLSLSLGTPDWHTMEENCDSSGDIVVAAVNAAVSQGVVTVISAGNEGETVDGISSPACASGAIAVGAVDKSDIRASWSNYGEALDLVAPGVNILSTYSCVAGGDCGSYWYGWMSGTSMSAPHVAGTAALILQKNPDYSANDVKAALYNTAVDLGAEGWDQYHGYGRIDALGAVNYQKSCESNAECDDGNECTEDTCNISTGTCSNTPVGDNTGCTDGVCCSGECIVGASECPTYVCGNGICEIGEDCYTCQSDCACRGKDCSKSCCGDGQCTGAENSKNCPVDC